MLRCNCSNNAGTICKLKPNPTYKSQENSLLHLLMQVKENSFDSLNVISTVLNI